MAEGELLAIALIRPLPGSEGDAIQALRELKELLRRKSYSRDALYRDVRNPERLFLVRYWQSEEARGQAQEDPEVHRLWQRLSELCTVEAVHESLEELYS